MVVGFLALIEFVGSVKVTVVVAHVFSSIVDSSEAFVMVVVFIGVPLIVDFLVLVELTVSFEIP